MVGWRSEHRYAERKVWYRLKVLMSLSICRTKGQKENFDKTSVMKLTQLYYLSSTTIQLLSINTFLPAFSATIIFEHLLKDFVSIG